MKTYCQQLPPLFLWVCLSVFFYGITACKKTDSITGTISGAVTEEVTMTLSGDSSGSTTTNSNGSYRFINLKNGRYTVTPEKNGYKFFPTNKNVTVNDDKTSVDFAAGIDLDSISGGTFLLSCVNEKPGHLNFKKSVLK